MSVQPLIKRFFVYAVMVCLGILIGAQLMGAASASPPSSDENLLAQTTDPQANPMEPDTVKWYTCTLANVVVWTERVHVKCTVADGVIQYFAAPNSNSKHAARVLSTLLTAQATGNQVAVQYDTLDTSGTAYGCLASNCRPILALSIDSP